MCWHMPLVSPLYCMPAQLPIARTFISLPKGFLWLPDPALSMCRAGQKGWGIRVPSQEPPQSVNDDSCQINTPTPLFSKWKNSETFSMDTQSYLLGSIKLQFAHSGHVLDEAISTGLLPFSVLFLHSPTSAFWDHLSNTLFGLFEFLFLGEPNLRKP